MRSDRPRADSGEGAGEGKAPARPPTRRPGLAAVAVTCLALPLLAACADRSGNQAGGASHPVSPALTAATVRATLTLSDATALPDLPVAALQLSPARAAVLQDAAAVAVSGCMARLGVRYSAPTATSTVGQDPRLRRYGISDLAMARRYGYHLPGKEADPTPFSASTATAPTRSMTALLDGSDRVAPDGAAVPAGGCVAQARTALAAPAAPSHAQILANGKATGILSRIDAASYIATKSSPKVRAVFAKWSACMASRGYDFASPIAALDAADLQSATVSKAEIRQAVADVTCKQRTDLVARWAALEAPLQRAALAKAAPDLASYAAEVHSQLRAAASLLGLQGVPA